MHSRPLTPSSDPRREMPRDLGARLDHIHVALASLAEEERRFERLGLELPLARCHQAKRFWSFVAGLHEAASRAADSECVRGDAWRDAA